MPYTTVTHSTVCVCVRVRVCMCACACACAISMILHVDGTCTCMYVHMCAAIVTHPTTAWPMYIIMYMYILYVWEGLLVY